MKNLFTFFSIIFLSLTLSTCKKFNEGGLLALSRKHLFGERKDNASKTWKLKLYEVNGIDSTYLIPGTSQIPNYYDQFITFKLDNKEGYTYKANTFLYEYFGYANYAGNKEIGISCSGGTFSQCRQINNTTICVRNILQPEGPFSKNNWHINKLTTSEFIFSLSLQNSYRIILTQ
jgi:hypothetical protein